MQKGHLSGISFMILALLAGCSFSPSGSTSDASAESESSGVRAPLFSPQAPQNDSFRQELQYLSATRQLTRKERAVVEKQTDFAQSQLGVPRALLWCVLFQESRFDPFKNATLVNSARGIGQFTRSALDEINEDTDNFDERTGGVLRSAIRPKKFPIAFKLVKQPHTRSGRFRYSARNPRNSYFNHNTAVLASAAYLNNRYWQIRMALDAQGIHYDPEVLWLYAAAAYNKGARSVLVLLTEQQSIRGERALSELLQSRRLTTEILTRQDVLNEALRDLWPEEIRDKYIEELARNMQFITACALPRSAA